MHDIGELWYLSGWEHPHRPTRDPVLTNSLARDLMGLGGLDSSPEALLDGIASLAARCVPDCAGASVLVWLEDEVARTAASHPELGRLLELQTTFREGPHWAARRAGEPVAVADLVADERWPRFRAAGLSSGVRSILAFPVIAGNTVVTTELAAVRPGVFGPAGAGWEPGTGALPVLLTEQIAVAARRTERHEAAVREARQMRRALDSRDLIGQAKGVLMVAHGLHPEAAFDLLRRNAQRSQRKLADVARQVIADHAARREASPPVRDRSPG